MTVAGNGDGSDENIIVNFDDVANTAGWSSGTGVITWIMTGLATFQLGDSAACDSTPGVTWIGDLDTGFCHSQPNELMVDVGGAQSMNWTATDFRSEAANFLSWSGSDDNARAAADSGVARGAAGVLTINDGVTRTTYRDLRLRALQFASRPTVTVDGATTFAVASSYTVLACTGAETINTITGGATGMIVYLENTDTDCTIADDDDPTAANAVDLTGSATNDVGAVKKIIGLIYNGTDWLQLLESDN